MANLFGGTDLFGNNRTVNMDSFNPEYQNVSTGVVDVGGNVVGQVPLDPYHYASQNTANQVAQILGGTVNQTSAVGPGANTTPQYGINFGDPNHSLNAGLAAKTLEYATKGRLNADTGQYEKEPMEAVMARLAADARPPLYWQQQGQANPYIPNPAGTMAIPQAYQNGASRMPSPNSSLSSGVQRPAQTQQPQSSMQAGMRSGGQAPTRQQLLNYGRSMLARGQSGANTNPGTGNVSGGQSPYQYMMANRQRQTQQS